MMQRYVRLVPNGGTANNFFQNITHSLRFRSVSEPPSAYFLSYQPPIVVRAPLYNCHEIVDNRRSRV